MTVLCELKPGDRFHTGAGVIGQVWIVLGPSDGDPTTIWAAREIPRGPYRAGPGSCDDVKERWAADTNVSVLR